MFGVGYSLSIHGRGVREPETRIDISEFPTSLYIIKKVLHRGNAEVHTGTGWFLLAN